MTDMERHRKLAVRLLREGCQSELGRMICVALLSEGTCGPPEIRAGVQVMHDHAGGDPVALRDLAALEQVLEATHE